MGNEAKLSQANGDFQIQVEQDLLDALLRAPHEPACEYIDGYQPLQPRSPEEDCPPQFSDHRISYPWNPTELQSETFFNHLDAHLGLDDWSEAEVQVRSEALFNRVDALFTELAERQVQKLKTVLAQRFTRVPQELLATIAHQAQQVLASSSSLAEQMVKCAQEALPQWSETDLYVLARPLAYAMRGSEVEITTEWQQLSEIGKAKLSMEIAHYALTQINPEAPDQQQS